MRKLNIFAISWAFLFALAWLIPNHYQPWTSFHSDAWIAFVGLSLVFPVLLNRKQPITLPLCSVIVLLIATVPWIHYSVGMLSFAGQAWMTTAYVAGFGLAIIVGNYFESKQNALLPDAMFGAILLASIASVGLSLGSWAGVIDTGLDDYLSMGYSGGRHYANLGQPNMLGSLLLWGILSCLWAYQRKVVRFEVALAAAAFLIVGIVLTRSRTAYVAGLILVVLQVLYWKKTEQKKTYLLTAILVACYFLSVHSLSWLDAHFFQRVEAVDYVRSSTSGDIRLTAWAMFLDAIMERPWLGYGWTEVANAQIAVAELHPSLGGMFGHTHNLVLDLFVWFGIPLALLTVGSMALWILTVFRRVRNEQDFLLLMLLVVIGTHSMLEYPLHYATFLLPTGLLVGIVCSRIQSEYSVKTNSLFLLVVTVGFSVLLVGVVRDYLRVEDSYNKWRFDLKGLVYPNPNALDVPEVLYLTQFRYWFEMVRIRPNSNMSEEQLIEREKIVRAFPSSGGVYELALAYALNGNTMKASYWLARICKLSNESECAILTAAWKVEAQKHPQLKFVLWPEADRP